MLAADYQVVRHIRFLTFLTRKINAGKNTNRQAAFLAVRVFNVSSLHRHYPNQVQTVGGVTGHPLSLATQAPARIFNCLITYEGYHAGQLLVNERLPF
jgi:hypothetical protein